MITTMSAWSDKTSGFQSFVLDVSNFDRFAIMMQNSSTVRSWDDIRIFGSYYPMDSASDTVDTYVEIPTASLPFACSIGTLSSVVSRPFANAYRYIKVKAMIAGTPSFAAGTLKVTIGGIGRTRR